MNKKADSMALKALFGVVIMLIVFFWPGKMLAQGLFNLDTAEERTFNNLIATIEGVSNSVDKDTTRVLEVRLKVDQGIIGFTKNSIEVRVKTPIRGAKVFKRPDQCTEGMACICRCSAGLMVPMDVIFLTDPIVCAEKELDCRSLDKLNFPATTNSKALGSDSDYDIEGGFIIVSKNTENTKSSKVNAYVKNLGSGIIAVCTVREECFP